MANSPNLGLERLVEGQASGEITHNAMVNKVDALLLGSVKDRDLNDPPGGESEGDRYIVAAAAINAWAGHEGEIAAYYGGWVFIVPQNGWRIWVDDEERRVEYYNDAWRGISVFIRKMATETVAVENTVYQNDDDLVFAVGADDIWIVHACLFVSDLSAAQAAGFKFKWVLPAGTDISGECSLIDVNADDVEQAHEIQPAGNSLALPGAPPVAYPLRMDFHLYSGTAGNVQLQWAKVVALAGDLKVVGVSSFSSYLYARRAETEGTLYS